MSKRERSLKDCNLKIPSVYIGACYFLKILIILICGFLPFLPCKNDFLKGVTGYVR